jgi:hypothetical protein
MVYVVQNAQNFSGLFPLSCIPKKHDVSETGSVSSFRNVVFFLEYMTMEKVHKILCIL